MHPMLILGAALAVPVVAGLALWASGWLTYDMTAQRQRDNRRTADEAVRIARATARGR